MAPGPLYYKSDARPCEPPLSGPNSRLEFWTKELGYVPCFSSPVSRNGKRRIRAGRTRVRNMLYMAIMSAIQSNPVFKARYETLKANGKPPKVAMVACMRKLITTLNVMAKTGQHWNPETV